MSENKAYNMSSKDFFLYRILPGFLSLVLLTSPIWTTLLGLYDFLLIYLAFISVYIFYFAFVNVLGNVIASKRLKVEENTDWKSKILKLNFKDLPNRELLPSDISKLIYIFMIPVVREDYETMHNIVSSIASQDHPFMKNVIIVFGQEERGGPERKDLFERLRKEFKGKVRDIWYFTHPNDIPGEIMGDACANLRWAGVETSKKLKAEKIDSKYVVFTKSDSDAIYHPKYLSALTYKYLTAEKRNNKFYSPAFIIYSNNYWKVPAITRVFSSTLTTGIAGEWIFKKNTKQSFACYSANFSILEQINFWDASAGAEDTYFYWNAFLNLDGDFSGEEIYLPLKMDCIEGKNYFLSLKGLYKQQVRWGWGVLIMSIAIQGMVKNKRIAINKKLGKFLLLFTVYNFLSTMSILLTFSVPLMTLINPNMQYSPITYLLPKAISYVLTASILSQIPTKYYIWKYYGAPPKEKSIWFKIWWWVGEPFLLFINLWTYYLLPRSQALIELTSGKKRTKFFVAHDYKSSTLEMVEKQQADLNQETKSTAPKQAL